MTDATAAIAGRPGFRGSLVVAGAWLATLPERPLVAAAESAGELWYRLAPARRDRRGPTCAASAKGWPRRPGALAARGPPPTRALERLVRPASGTPSATTSRSRGTGATTSRPPLARMDVETPDDVRATLQSPASRSCLGLHFGAIELPVVLAPHLVGPRHGADGDRQRPRRSPRWFRDTRKPRRGQPRPRRQRATRPARRAAAGRLRGPRQRPRPDGWRASLSRSSGTRADPRRAPRSSRSRPACRCTWRRAGARRRPLRGPAGPRAGPASRAPPRADTSSRPVAARSRRSSPGPGAVVGRVPPDLAGPRQSARRPAGRTRRGRSSSVSGPRGHVATADPTERRGRADLHIHSLASDGTSSVGEILDHVAAQAFLDVIAITDHERIDAALAARHMAEDRGPAVRVIVGEEITTRGGHLLGLFLERPVPRASRASAGPSRPSTTRAGSPSPPTPSSRTRCAPRARAAAAPRRRDPRRPDAIETFNPTALGRYRHDAVVAFAETHGLPQIGNSDAHVASAIGAGWTAFHGRTPEDLLAALAAGGRATTAASTGRSGSSPSSACSCASTQRDMRAEPGRPRPPRRHGPRPRLPRRHAAAAALEPARDGRGT